MKKGGGSLVHVATSRGDVKTQQTTDLYGWASTNPGKLRRSLQLFDGKIANSQYCNINIAKLGINRCNYFTYKL